LAEHGHPRRIDKIQLRQIAQRRIGVERLAEQAANKVKSGAFYS